MKLIILLFIGLSSFAVQSADGDINHWRETIAVARKSSVSLKMKEQAAQKVLDFLRADLKSEFKANSSEDLYKKALADPDKLGSLINQEGRYKDLFTDFSRLVSQITSEKALRSCEEYGSVKQSISEGLASYSPCLEGGYSHSFLSWDIKTPEQLKSKEFNIPNFLYSENLSDLLTVTNKLSTHSVVKSNSPLVSSPDEIQKENPQDDPEAWATHKKMIFQKDIYQRSIFNVIRNIMSLKIQYGKKSLTADEINKNINQEISKTCLHCDEGSKKSISLRMNYLLKSEMKQGNLKYRPAQEVAQNLCQTLNDHRYPFYQPFRQNELTPLSLLAGKGKAQSEVYKKERVKVLSQVAQKGNDGLLIFTEAITNLDEKVPERINLKCNKSSFDANLILKAGEEGASKAREFAKTLNNDLVLKSDLKSINDNIRFMARMNPRSFGEALNQHPELSRDACSVLKSIKQEDVLDKSRENAILWGSSVVGTAFTLTGVFAPVGQAISLMSIAAATTLSLSNTAFQFYSAEEHKEKAELMNQATFATGDKKLMAISQQEFQEYQDIKIQAMVSLGLSASDVGRASREFIKSGMTFRKVLDSLRTKFVGIKTVEADGFLQKLISFKEEERSKISSALKALPSSQVDDVLLKIKANPEHFKRYDEFQPDLLSLEALKPGSAKQRFDQNAKWAFRGSKNSFKIPEFKKDVVLLKDDLKMRDAVQETVELFESPKKVYEHMQTLEDEVLLDCLTNNPNFLSLDAEARYHVRAKALEKALAKIEQSHGFISAKAGKYEANVLDDKVYTMDEWHEMLRKGQAFNDATFKIEAKTGIAELLDNEFIRSGHGYMTHRVQFYVLMKEMDRNPRKFHHLKGSDLFKKLGDREFNKKLGMGDDSVNTLWQHLFDSMEEGTYRRPEFFRQTHDDYPELGAWL